MRRVTAKFWVPAATGIVVTLALLPGSWRPAEAQTGGEVGDTPTSTTTSTSTTTATSTTTSTATSTTTSTATSTSTSTTTATATSTALATPTATSTVIGTSTATVTSGGTNVQIPGGSLPPGSRLSVSSDVRLQSTATATATGTARVQQSLNNARDANQQSAQFLLKLNVDFPTASNTQFKTQFVTDLASALKISASRIQITSVVSAGFSQAPVLPTRAVPDNPRGETILKTPATVRFAIPDEAFVLAGGDARRIIVLRMPDDPLPTDKWFEVDCTASGQTLACTTDRFSIWMMMVIPAPQVLAQATATTGATPAGPRPASTGLGVAEDSPAWPVRVGMSVLLAGALAGATGWQISRRRRAA